MKAVKKYSKSLLVVVLVVASVISGGILNHFVKADNVEQNDVASVKRDTSIFVNSAGDLNIERTKKEEKIMGKENTWTIMIYMDGSDLELCYGKATKDLKEIMSARIAPSTIENVNILVQIGGCTYWHYPDINGEKLQRYKIESIGGPTLLEEHETKNMGDPETLYDFLDWGVENYPAEHMGVIFWNHGSGVSNGVCVDKQDSLLVPEIEYAFAKVSQKMTSKFELVGFDTCLTGSLEYANALAPYAKYMIASANIEPGDGWSYQDTMNVILDNPDATGAEVGKATCDAYYKELSKDQSNSRLTLATYDLDKVDNVCIEMNKLAKYMYDNVKEDQKHYERFANMQSASERITYGEDGENMDIGSLLFYFDSSYNYQYDTSAFKQALNEFIVYSRLSEVYEKYNGVGLSIYYPTDTITMPQFGVMRNVVFSPYYLKYLEYIAYIRGGRYASNYQEIDWENSDCFYEDSFEFLKYYKNGKTDDTILRDTLLQNPKYVQDGFVEKWMNNFGKVSSSGSYSAYGMHRNIVTKCDKSNYSAEVGKDNVNTVINVYDSIFTKMGDSLVCLGEDNSATLDKDTGKITSNFNGEWLMLPDGQLLTTYINEDLGSVVYEIPVLINDIEMTIKIEEIDNNGKKEYNLLGVWDATDQSNYAPRGYLPLEVGTTITPIYDVYDPEADTYESEYGEEYTIASDFDFLFGQLDDGEYSYAFAIEGINGEVSFSSLVDYSSDGKDF